MSGDSESGWQEYRAHLAYVESAPADTTSKLGINVIFTDKKGTRAALQEARYLAKDLRGTVNLLAFQFVPLAFPLSRPPVSIVFTQKRLIDFVNEGTQGDLETVVRLYLCRDKGQALAQALAPASLVVLGGKRHRWLSKERRLERQLKKLGHQVIFAELR